MGDFQLNVPGWYVPQSVQENEFLNSKLESDKYGIFYSVKFEGDADTFLWQAKTAPVEGQKYYGHLETTKSGKSTKFKREKPPEEAASATSISVPHAVDKPFFKDASTIPADFMKSLLGYYDVQSLVVNGKPTPQFTSLVETAKALAEEAMSMVDNVRGVKNDTPKPRSLGDEFRNREMPEDISALDMGVEDLPSDW